MAAELPPAADSPWVYIIGAAIAFAGVVWSYLKGLHIQANKPSSEISIVGGAFADRIAIERLATAIEETADILKDIRKEMLEHGRNQEISELRRKVDELMAAKK